MEVRDRVEVHVGPGVIEISGEVRDIFLMLKVLKREGLNVRFFDRESDSWSGWQKI